MRISKKDSAVISAFLTLVSGITLAVAAFIRSPVGEIADGVLWYVAQCLVYAGSIFGVSIYLQQELENIRDKLKDN